MKELRDERETFGNDETSIRRAVRVYEHEGTKYMLELTYTGKSSSFALDKMQQPNDILRPIKCVFPEKCSWENAISIMVKEITGKEKQKGMCI